MLRAGRQSEANVGQNGGSVWASRRSEAEGLGGLGYARRAETKSRRWKGVASVGRLSFRHGVLSTDRKDKLRRGPVV